jgi:hypothetical protein
MLINSASSYAMKMTDYISLDIVFPHVTNTLLCQYQDPQSGRIGVESEVRRGGMGIICIEPSEDQSEIGFAASSYSQPASLSSSYDCHRLPHALRIHTRDGKEGIFTCLISRVEAISV